MARSWYIIHTYTGYEQKIYRTISALLEEKKIDPAVLIQVKVPVEKIEETVERKRNGNVIKEKRVRDNLLLPGYVMVELDLPQLGWKDICSQIRRIQGVTGFVGTKPNEKPRPISPDEAKALLQTSGDMKSDKVSRIKQAYEVGDKVKITEGSFATFEGTVEEILADKNKLRVNVQIFGRPTPVEVDVLQVEKI